jgi:Flp pilus assembly protein TadD
MVHNERALADPDRREEELLVALELSREALRVARARDLLAPQMKLHEGLVLMNLGRDQEALETFDAYVREVPGDAHGLVNLGLVLCRLNGFTQAVAPLERAVAIAPGDEKAWRYLGLAYEGVGRPDAAEAAYERSLMLAPDQPMATMRLEALRRAGGE